MFRVVLELVYRTGCEYSTTIYIIYLMFVPCFYETFQQHVLHVSWSKRSSSSTYIYICGFLLNLKAQKTKIDTNGVYNMWIVYRIN